LPGFEGLVDHFMEEWNGFYKEWYDSSTPQEFPMPEKWAHLDKFMYLAL
jgi:hypothetical protein